MTGPLSRNRNRGESDGDPNLLYLANYPKTDLSERFGLCFGVVVGGGFWGKDDEGGWNTAAKGEVDAETRERTGTVQGGCLHGGTWVW